PVCCHGLRAFLGAGRPGGADADSGVTACCFDDRAARLESAVLLRRLDDRKADPVLERSARIEEFGFRVYRRTDAPCDERQANHRVPADGIEASIYTRLVLFV